jgi:hypothetical protein
MPGYDRLGRHQRELLRALRDGAELRRDGAQWRVQQRDGAWLVNGEACASLYARGYVMFDERRGAFVLTLKGREA